MQTQVDLFKPSNSPKDLAVSRAISLSVKAFTEQNFRFADYYFEMAEKFLNTDPHHFEPQGD